MSNLKKVLILSITVVMVIGFFFAYHAIKEKEKSDEILVEMILRDGGQSYEVQYNVDKSKTILVSEVEEEVLSVVPRVPLEVLRLPKVDDSDNTLENKEPVSALTYISTLEESAQYLNYLKEEGYEVVRQIHTPQYIDEVFTRGTTSKRVVIFRDTIMVGSLVDNSEFPRLERYLKKYK